MPDLHGWTMTPWHCACGRVHAPWWRSTPPPSCPIWNEAPTARRAREARERLARAT